MRFSEIRCLLFLNAAGLLLISSIAVAAGPGGNRDQNLVAVSQLDVDIRAVSSDGYWMHADREGWIRFVVIGGGVEHYATRLYLQWLAQADDGADIEVLKTVSVEELNGPDGDPGIPRSYTFGVPRCEQRVPCVKAVLDIFDSRAGISRQFQLLLNAGPGNYRIEEIENSQPGG